VFFKAMGSKVGSKTAKWLGDQLGSGRLLDIAAHVRASDSFRVPSGKVLILVACRGQGELSTDDVKAAEEVEAVVAKGHKKGRDYEIRHISAPLSAEDRQKHLVLICGANPMWPDLVDNTHLLQDIDPSFQVARGDRSLRWRNREYRWGDAHDCAILAVKRNPYNPKRRVVVLAGMRSIGTLGAAQVFASPEHEITRRSVISEYARAADDVEVVLFVAHDDTRQTIRELRIAKPDDAPPVTAGASVDPNANALRRIYESLNRQPRGLHVQDFGVTLVMTRDFGVVFRREFTWIAAGDDILVQGASFGADAALGPGMFTVEPTRLGETAGDLIVVRAVDDPLVKRFLLFPVPPIRPGDVGRRYRLEGSEWPGAMRALRVKGNTDTQTIEVPRHTAKPIDRVSFEIQFQAPGAAFRVGAGADTECTWEPNMIFQSGQPFQCHWTDVPSGKKLEIIVERTIGE